MSICKVYDLPEGASVNRHGAGELLIAIEQATGLRNDGAIILREHLLHRKVRRLEANNLVAIYRELSAMLGVCKQTLSFDTRYGKMRLGDVRWRNLNSICEMVEDRIRQCCQDWMREEY